MSDLPDPLTPPECDLRGLPYMPLYGDRLFTSETWLSARPEGKAAMQQLWWRSYAHEVPAASLPDNDALLASYVGYGAAVSAWRKVRAEAMRGWIKCSDGRLYHPFVAQIALEAWEARRRNRDKQRQWRERTRTKTGDATVTPAGDETVTVGVTETDARPLRNAGNRRERDIEENNKVERVFDALWKTWPDEARKRHTRAEVRDAVRSQLKAGADPDAIIAAGKAHVAERVKDDPKVVKGLVPWLKRGLWRNWAPNGNGADEPADWPRRIAHHRETGEWLARWGPPPGQPGYLGPPSPPEADLFPPEVH